MKKHRTVTEKAYHEAVASLPCAACDAIGVQLHHIRVGQGMSQRAGHGLVIPLCPDCHTGNFSIHSSRRQFQAVYGSELALLNDTILEVFRREM